MAEIGERVGAILSIDTDNKVVHLLGYGAYQGDEIPETAIGFMAEVARKMGRKNPKIVLDDGKVVWGCECWWGPESQVRQQVEKREAAGFTVTNVDIDKLRDEFNNPPKMRIRWEPRDSAAQVPEHHLRAIRNVVLEEAGYPDEHAASRAFEDGDVVAPQEACEAIRNLLEAHGVAWSITPVKKEDVQ